MKESVHHACRSCGMPVSGSLPGGLCGACLGRELFADEPEGLPFTHIGDYELLEEIGRGGMGLVYRARQVSLNRPAAVKLILTGPLASAVERQRFIAEASAAAALEHPGIVSVYEAGEEDGQPFFAMQLIEGTSLAARLKLGPSFPPRAAAELIHRTALAVQHAHERGFLHRDLKPGNILLDDKGAPHVTDFGLARRVDDESHLTLTGAAVGTPSYMAPEQTDTRRPPTTAVDVYSLGAILYELLSGNPPFRADSLPDLFLAIREKEPASISTIRAEVDRDLDIICRKCLEKEPLRRYRSAQAFADDLQRWLQGEPITARAVGRTERFLRWCRRRPAVAGLAAAVIMLFISGLSGIVWQWRRANAAAHTAVAALAKSEEALWRANVNEARALRISRARGQRTGSLAALAAAAAYRVTPELRNEAIAALALPDLGEPVFHAPLQAGAEDVVADLALQRLAYRRRGDIIFQNLGAAEPSALIEAGDIRYMICSRDLDYVLAISGPEIPSASLNGTLWRTKDRSRVLTVEDILHGAEFTPDARQLLVSRADRLELYDTAAGQLLDKALTTMGPREVSISPDGKRAILMRSGRMELWNLHPLTLAKRLPPLSQDAYIAEWHPDGQAVVCGSNAEAFVITPGNGETRAFARHDREGVYVNMHPLGGFAATTAWDGILRFHHPALNDPLLQTSGLRPCQFSGDGKSLLIKVGTRPGICQVTPPDVWRVLPLRGDENEGSRSMDFSPDGKWLAVVSQHSLALWDPVTLRMSPPLPLEAGEKAVFTGSHSLLVLDRVKGLKSVNITESSDGPTLEAGDESLVPKNGQSFFALAPNNARILMNGAAPTVYEMKTGAPLFSLAATGLIDNPAWSPDGRWLATGYWNNRASAGSMARIWSPDDGRLLKELPAGNCAPFFTPDCRRLFVSSTHECVVYETETWRELARYPREASGLDHGVVTFAPDADLAALMADESTVRLLRLSTGEEIAKLAPPLPHKVSTGGLTFSGNGRWLACEARKSIRLWDLKLLRERLRAIGLDWP